MSTSSVTPASSSSTTPITFNGSSTYSSAFQQVITRAVGIASLPMQMLQTQVTTLSGQQTTVTGLGSDFEALQTSLQALGSQVAGTPTAQVSDPTAVSAAATAGALPGTYTIQVDDVGSSSVSLSNAGSPPVTDPTTNNISDSSSFTLTVNSKTSTITPSGGSLEDLATAINSAGDGVQATIVNLGSNASPDYRLAVTSTELGPDTISLADSNGNQLLNTLSTGTYAEYAVNGGISNGNGGTNDVQSTSDQVTLSPGLTVSLLAQTTSPATITVSNTTTGLQSALSSFVSTYNTAVTDLQKNEGQNGGALQGDSVVYTLNNILSQIAQYASSSSGSVGSLADLGITLQENGQLSFDGGTALASANPTDVQNFLGSVDSSGFLQSVNNDLTSVSDPTNGIIAGDYNAIQAEITSDNTQISNDQYNITNLQTNLQSQLSQADAAIATLQSQVTYFGELFQAEYGTNGTSSTGG
jgi:flagellar hook-associated protein 2